MLTEGNNTANGSNNNGTVVGISTINNSSNNLRRQMSNSSDTDIKQQQPPAATVTTTTTSTTQPLVPYTGTLSSGVNVDTTVGKTNLLASSNTAASTTINKAIYSSRANKVFYFVCIYIFFFCV